METLILLLIGVAIGFGLGRFFRGHSPEEQTVCQHECGKKLLSATCYSTQKVECGAALSKDCKGGKSEAGATPR